MSPLLNCELEQVPNREVRPVRLRHRRCGACQSYCALDNVRSVEVSSAVRLFAFKSVSILIGTHDTIDPIR